MRRKDIKRPPVTKTNGEKPYYPGRPVDYVEREAEEIIERLSTGESLNKILQNERMPAMHAFYRWLASDPEYRRKYDDARLMQADSLFDSILDGAMDEAINVPRARLIADVKQYVIGRLNPKRYQPSTRIEQSIEMPVLVPDEVEKD